MNISVSDKFYTDWNSVGICHIKNLIKDTPSWENILQILNNATRETEPKIGKYITSPSNFEIIYKDMIATKVLHYPNKENINEYNIESDATFFFSLFFNKNDISAKISESISNQINSLSKELKIETDFSSLKISLAEKFVPYEKHDWYTCIIQFQGTTYWKLKNIDAKLEDTYILESGDCLFFKNEIWHELTNDGPRSSLVGRFIFLDEELN